MIVEENIELCDINYKKRDGYEEITKKIISPFVFWAYVCGTVFVLSSFVSSIFTKKGVVQDDIKDHVHETVWLVGLLGLGDALQVMDLPKKDKKFCERLDRERKNTHQWSHIP